MDVPHPAARVPPSASRDCDLQFVIPRPGRVCVCVTHRASSGMLMQRMWDRKFQVASLFLCRKNPTVLTQAVWVFWPLDGNSGHRVWASPSRPLTQVGRLAWSGTLTEVPHSHNSGTFNLSF